LIFGLVYLYIEKSRVILQRDFRLMDTFCVETWALYHVRVHQRTELRMDDAQQRCLNKTFKIS